MEELRKNITTKIYHLDWHTNNITYCTLISADCSDSDLNQKPLLKWIKLEKGERENTVILQLKDFKLSDFTVEQLHYYSSFC